MSSNDEKSMQSNPGLAGGKRFQIRQKMLSIGNDYTIENEQGATVYKVDGKVGWHKTFIFEDAQGKALITPLREHFTVSVQNGPDLEIHGNLLDHEYTIGDGQNKVSVQIEAGQDEVVLLAVVVCIDEMTHSGN